MKNLILALSILGSIATPVFAEERGARGIRGINPSLLSGEMRMKVQVDSAGAKGWDKARCQGLLNKWDNLVGSAGNDIAKGNNASADAKLDKAWGMFNTLTGKCVVSGIEGY